MSTIFPELKDRKATLHVEAKTLAEGIFKVRKEHKKAIAEFKKSVAAAPDGAKQVRTKVKEHKDAMKKVKKDVKAKREEARKIKA